MARIRTVKPEFFDDEKLATISLQARLVFIGLLVHSDDYGVVKGHPLWLKNQILPYDDISLPDFTDLLQELVTINCIVAFCHSGEQYYHIRKFSEHQKVEKPSKWRNPEYLEDTPRILPEYSPNTPLPVGKKSATLPAGKEGNSKGKEIVRAMEGECEGEPDHPVDNSTPCPPFPEMEKEKVALKEKPDDDPEMAEIRNLISQVKTKHPTLAIETWYGKNLSVRKDAIAHVLRSLLKAEHVEYGLAYLQAALNVEIGKYNARDFDAGEAKKKQEREQGDLKAVGNVLAGLMPGRAGP